MLVIAFCHLLMRTFLKQSKSVHRLFYVDALGRIDEQQAFFACDQSTFPLCLGVAILMRLYSISISNRACSNRVLCFAFVTNRALVNSVPLQVAYPSSKTLFVLRQGLFELSGQGKGLLIIIHQGIIQQNSYFYHHTFGDKPIQCTWVAYRAASVLCLRPGVYGCELVIGFRAYYAFVGYVFNIYLYFLTRI